jgi:hypothetical protein
MPTKPRANLDKNVSPNWKPVEGLDQRKQKMDWSVRIWHWLVSLGGLALVGLGVLLIAYLGLGKWGGTLIGIGFCIFVLGAPDKATRNGYRSL